MIIAIDGYEANVDHPVGIGRFAHEIICGLHALTQKRTDIEVRVYLPETAKKSLPESNVYWNYYVRSPKKLWTFAGLPKALWLDRPFADVVFSPTHYIPRFVTIPRVCSIMDLSYLNYPELFKQEDLYKLVKWTAFSARHAKKIITISDFTRSAIINEYKKSISAVPIVYPGFTPMKNANHVSIASLTEKFGITKSFVLSVGTLQPRKNYVRLIEAFSGILKEQEKIFPNLELVIVGKKGWLYEDILTAPQKFGVENQVKFLEFVSDEELITLYKHALCLVIPSLYEGFGLPVLEAMTHGCSVVVSNVSSLPEVAGEAGIYIEPTDVTSIANGLVQALKERGSASEIKRVQTGLAHAATFTWEKASAQVLDILESVAKENT